MKKRNLLRLVLVWLLIICMFGQTVAMAAQPKQEDSISFEKVDDSMVTASLLDQTQTQTETNVELYSDTDIVRVSIILEDASTIDQGYATKNIAGNFAANAYRQQVLDKQTVTQNAIERRLGEKLDVEWNLALITNLISADVEYGQIEKIKQVDGVEDVLIDQLYYPDVYSDDDDSAQADMYFSSEMVNTGEAWESGYTGAGTCIAIIDTGLDTDHQSVSAKAYEYALAQNAATKGMEYNEYIETLDLMDTQDIKEVLTRLNAYSKGGTSADKLYINSKIPFGYCYSYSSYDVTHDNDDAGNHGSHVAGIAAANRFIEVDGEMVDALDTVYVAGTAPDAQILVMDVFGGQGAYGADILAGVEDAIMLGADTVNLSLGTVFPGFSTASSLGGFLEKLKNTDTVVTISAGNSYDWAYLSRPGTLYADDINTDTMGDPGSGTEALTIASVENTGKITTGTLTVGGQMVTYSETFSYSSNPKNTPIMNMDTSADSSGTDYEYVLFEHYSYEDSYVGYEDRVKGKIVLCSRGDNSFSEKANNAMKAGAIAVIIYNNVSGSINMDLSNFVYEAPCVFITKEAAQKFIKAGTEHEGHDGQTYYTGTTTVCKGQSIVPGVEGAAYEMSVFSSWGVTGDLTLKPELTAPGGYIYSIDGSHKDATDRYTTMSGTSMAAPQIAGIGALVKEFIKDNGYSGIFANSQRGLVQSILMSTATPIKDSNGNYYPVMQQGAGLANAAEATSADSYIKMTKKATASYDDGKVKAELGDDPERTGVYTFSFELHNLDGQEHTYDLSADVFAQDSYEALAKTGSTDPEDNLDYKTYFMDRDTRPLEATTTFTVNGSGVSAITVPAGGSITVKATITLAEAAKKDYIEKYFKNGTYIQAYVFAEGRADAEGVEGTCHSIPVLAFYGNWTDPSMFYGTSSYEGQFAGNYSTPSTTDNSRWPYFIWTDAYQGEEIPTWNHFKANTGRGSFMIGGNPLTADEAYRPERNAVSGDITSVYWEAWLARNATQLQVTVKDADTGKSYGAYLENGEFLPAYSNNSGSDIGGVGGTLNRSNTPEEGSRLKFTLRALPEYYNDGKMGENSDYGEGAIATVTATVDSTVPNVLDMDLDNKENMLHVTAQDDQYISAIVLYNAAGDKVLTYSGAKQYDLDAGAKEIYDLDLRSANGTDFYVQAFDYAGNMATYRVVIKDGVLNYAGAMLAYDRETAQWVQIDKYKENLGKVAASETVYNAAVSVGDTVFAVTDQGKLYALPVNDFEDSTFVKTLRVQITDLAYNAADGYLYGVTDANNLIKIDPQSGSNSVVGMIPVTTNTLACGTNGNFYCNKYGTGEIYTFTLETVTSGISEVYDFNGDGTVSALDSQRLLDYVTGVTDEVNNTSYIDVDGDGDTDTYDVYFLQQIVGYYPEQIAVVSGLESKYLQAMEIDPNNGTLYWISYFSDFMGADEVGFAVLYEIDTRSGEVTTHYDYWHQLTAFVILDAEASKTFPPVGGVKNLVLSEELATLMPDESLELHAGFEPWNTSDDELIWTSSDESVATVDQSGVVTAVADGVCVITAVSVADSSISASCTVMVISDAAPEVPGIVAEVCANAALNNEQKAAYLAQAEKTVTVDLVLTAAEAMTNGLQTVTVETDLLELLSVSCDGLSSYTVSGDRTTVGFVPAETVKKDGELATLTFRVKDGGMDADLLIRELQRNNEHIDIETAVNLQSHAWSDWTQTTAPTCGAEGEETRSCADCGKTQTRPIPATGEHAWGEWNVTKAATDTEEGERERACGCGATETDSIHMTGKHIWSDWHVTKEATCAEDGERTGTCEDCDEVLTQVIPATGEHDWSAWTEAADGTKTKSCSGCDATQTKTVIGETEGTAIQEDFNYFAVGQHLIRDVQITGATVNSVVQLEAEPETGENYRLHYLVELGQYTNADETMHLKFRISEQWASGIGSAFVDTKKGSVSMEGDVTDYDVKLENGTGYMEAWSYWDGSTCCAIKIEFVIGDSGEPYMDPYVYYGNSTVNKLSVWDAVVVKESTFRVRNEEKIYSWSDMENTVYSYIWLDESTPDDAVVGIQLLRNNTPLALPEGWSENGGYVQLVDGEAVVSGTWLHGSGLDYWDVDHYVFYIKNHHISVAPETLQGSEISLQAEAGVPFTVDLRDYFADRNGDTLTYSISVDGAEATQYTSQKYRYTPKGVEDARVLTITASDGTLTSDTCTITITPIEDHVWGNWKMTDAGTCTTDGEETRVCICCGETETRAVVCVGEHVWGEWQEAYDEIGEATGTKLRQCHVCGELETDRRIVYGDSDGDGVVDVKDAVLMSRYLADWELPAFNEDAADVNGDHVVDNKDLVLLRRYIAGWEGIVLGPQ